MSEPQVIQALCASAQVMYSEFLTLVHSGNVQAAGIDDSTDKIYFTMKGHSSEQASTSTEAAAVAPVAATTLAAADSGEACLLLLV